ncbi:hypothetical protein CASFOL_042187 [Castilleja foliolosa]|uniref:Cystatin domain-containing protein n=1 Tax=Castilleja foliolosa TaxID=1961234 RepID=A0ABD3B9S6_9LAMI
MAISSASRSFLSVLFLILVISDEVFCRGHIEYPDVHEDELAQFAIAEVNKLAHKNYIMVNLESSLFEKESRGIFSYHLSISAKIGAASGAITYLAKIEIERKGEHNNKMMLVSFQTRHGRIIYERPTSDHTAEASTSSHGHHTAEASTSDRSDRRGQRERKRPAWQDDFEINN